MALNLADKSRHVGMQVIIDAVLILDARILYQTAEILVAHCDRAVDKVAHCVSQLRIHALDHELPGDDAVIFKRHLVKHEISDRVDAEDACHVVRVDNVSAGLAHLAAALKEPRMTEYLLRKRLAE